MVEQAEFEQFVEQEAKAQNAEEEEMEVEVGAESTEVVVDQWWALTTEEQARLKERFPVVPSSVLNLPPLPSPSERWLSFAGF